MVVDPWLLPEDIRLGSLESKFVDNLRSLEPWLAVPGIGLTVGAEEFAVNVLVYCRCTRLDP